MAAAKGAKPASALPVSTGQLWFAVATMFVVQIASGVDKKIIAMLVQPMSRDLQLSDEQIGLVIGLAFAVPNALLGLPLGYVADRFGRKIMLIWGVTLWSLSTMACGVSKSFPFLVAARAGIGVGDAVLSPTVFPILSSMAPAERRAWPTAVAMAGAPLGTALSLLLGGIIVHMTTGMAPIQVPLVGSIFAWQSAFFVAAAFSMLAILMLIFVRPPRAAAKAPGLGLAEACRYFLREWRAFAAVFGGAALFGINANGQVSWTPAYLSRTFDMGPAQIGGVMSAIILVIAVVGPATGGAVSKRTSKVPGRDMAVVAVLMLVNAMLNVYAYTAAAPAAAILALGLALVFSSVIQILPTMTIQNITPPPYRGQATGLLFSLVSVVGYGLGPGIIGLLTTRVVGENNLGLAMAITCAGASVLAAGAILIGLPGFKRLRTAAEVDRYNRQTGLPDPAAS